MCGLVGVAISSSNGYDYNSLESFKELLLMDTVRGEDSTGVCLVTNVGEVTVAKKATWAPNFMCSKAFTEINDKAWKTGKVLMGHNRKATVGAVSSENAHPFIVNNEFVLMHNGSLTTHKHLADTVVDSEAIAQYLHDKWKTSATPTEKAEILNHIGGAWALAWYDLRDETLNLVRNSQRPLSYVFTGGVLYWASDENMLNCVLKRYNVTVAPKSLNTFTVLTFDGASVQEVVLPTIPFPYKTPSTTSTTKVITVTKEEVFPENKLSKTAYKKFLRKITGQTIVFNVEDFVDVNGKTQWYGDKTEWSFDHELVGTLTDDNVMYDVLKSYSTAEGKVVSGFYHKESGVVKLHVEMIGAHNAPQTCH